MSDEKSYDLPQGIDIKLESINAASSGNTTQPTIRVGQDEQSGWYERQDGATVFVSYGQDSIVQHWLYTKFNQSVMLHEFKVPNELIEELDDKCGILYKKQGVKGLFWREQNTEYNLITGEKIVSDKTAQLPQSQLTTADRDKIISELELRLKSKLTKSSDAGHDTDDERANANNDILVLQIPVIESNIEELKTEISNISNLFAGKTDFNNLNIDVAKHSVDLSNIKVSMSTSRDKINDAIAKVAENTNANLELSRKVADIDVALVSFHDKTNLDDTENKSLLLNMSNLIDEIKLEINELQNKTVANSDELKLAKVQFDEKVAAVESRLKATKIVLDNKIQLASPRLSNIEEQPQRSQSMSAQNMPSAQSALSPRPGVPMLQLDKIVSDQSATLSPRMTTPRTAGDVISVSKLKSDVAEIQLQIKELITAAESLKASRIVVQEKTNNNANAISALQSNVASLQDKDLKHSATSEELRTTADILKADIAALKNMAQVSSSANDVRISDMEKNVTLTRNQTESLLTVVNSLNESSNQLGVKMATEFPALLKQTEQLQLQMGETSKQLGETSKQLGETSTEIQKVSITSQNNLTEVKNTIVDAQNSIAELKQSVDAKVGQEALDAIKKAILLQLRDAVGDKASNADFEQFRAQLSIATADKLDAKELEAFKTEMVAMVSHKANVTVVNGLQNELSSKLGADAVESIKTAIKNELKSETPQPLPNDGELRAIVDSLRIALESKIDANALKPLKTELATKVNLDAVDSLKAAIKDELTAPQIQAEFKQLDTVIDSINNNIDVLAQKINKTPQDIDVKLVAVNEKLADVTAKVADVDAKLVTINEKLVDVTAKVVDVDTKLVTINEKVVDVDAKLVAVNEKVDTKLVTINEKVADVDAKLVAVNEKVDTKLVDMTAKVVDVDAKLVTINEKVDTKLVDVTAKVVDVDTKLVTINEKVDAKLVDVTSKVDAKLVDVALKLTNIDETVTAKVSDIEAKLGTLAQKNDPMTSAGLFHNNKKELIEEIASNLNDAETKFDAKVAEMHTNVSETIQKEINSGSIRAAIDTATQSAHAAMDAISELSAKLDSTQQNNLIKLQQMDDIGAKLASLTLLTNKLPELSERLTEILNKQNDAAVNLNTVATKTSAIETADAMQFMSGTMEKKNEDLYYNGQLCRMPDEIKLSDKKQITAENVNLSADGGMKFSVHGSQIAKISESGVELNEDIAFHELSLDKFPDLLQKSIANPTKSYVYARQQQLWNMVNGKDTKIMTKSTTVVEVPFTPDDVKIGDGDFVTYDKYGILKKISRVEPTKIPDPQLGDYPIKKVLDISQVDGPQIVTLCAKSTSTSTEAKFADVDIKSESGSLLQSKAQITDQIIVISRASINKFAAVKPSLTRIKCIYQKADYIILFAIDGQTVQFICVYSNGDVITKEIKLDGFVSHYDAVYDVEHNQCIFVGFDPQKLNLICILVSNDGAEIKFDVKYEIMGNNIVSGDKKIGICIAPFKTYVISCGRFKLAIEAENCLRNGPVYIDNQVDNCASMYYNADFGVLMSFDSFTGSGCCVQILDLMDLGIDKINVFKVSGAAEPLAIVEDLLLYKNKKDTPILRKIVYDGQSLVTNTSVEVDAQRIKVCKDECYLIGTSLSSVKRDDLVADILGIVVKTMQTTVDVHLHSTLFDAETLNEDFPQAWIGKKLYLKNTQEQFPTNLSTSAEDGMLIGQCVTKNHIMLARF